MFTQLVIVISIICILVTVNKIVERRKSTSYPGGQILSLGLLSVAVAIFSYGIRDVLIQFNFGSEFIFYQIGGLFQLFGFFLIGIFVSRFISGKYLRRVVLFFWFVYFLFMAVSILFYPVKSIEKQAIFEPIPYRVISHPWESQIINISYVVGGLAFSILVLAIFLYNFIKMKERGGKEKAILYGLGIFFLFVPTLLCLFISPILGRLGYAIGAICLFFAIKIKSL